MRKEYAEGINKETKNPGKGESKTASQLRFGRSNARVAPASNSDFDRRSRRSCLGAAKNIDDPNEPD
jgi:hypothetical protein